MRVVLVALLGVALVGLLSPTAVADDDGYTEFGGHVVDSESGNGYVVEVETGNDGNDSSGSTQTVSDDGIAREYVRAPGCVSGMYRQDLTPACVNGDEVVEICLNGETALQPVWVRTSTDGTTWSSWVMQGWYECPGEAALLAAINVAWANLTPAPHDVNLQPDTGWAFSSIPTVAYVNPEPRTVSTTLTGVPVQIRANPQQFTWSWGDGETTTTTDSGAPHPDATLTHTYGHRTGDVSISVETAWTGQFSIDGGTNWFDIDGTVTSESTPQTLTLYNPHSNRVDCDLDGDCVSQLSARAP